jgi:hypothetical protein
MRLPRRWLGLPLAALLAACPQERTETDTVFLDDPMTPGQEGVAPAPTMTPEPMAMSESAQLQELQGSGIGGDVVVTARGAQTEVTVRLTNAPPNSTLPGHIHSGTCQNIGGVVQGLEPITTDATGAGTMTATASVQPMTAMDGQHIIVYHSAGAPATCAAIPAHAM